MNREEVEIEDEKGKPKHVPHPGSVAAWADANGVNVMAAEGLHDKLRRLFNKHYIVEKPAADSVAQIVKSLEAGKHVVLSFGAHESDLDYLLVSNLLTRHIRRTWEKKTNEFRSKGTGLASEPRPLIIVVEEAHKLLNREMASQTTFATIARELRKYYVTLLIVDQRPSQIYDEVMSQLGTRISGWLGDEDDIHAVLSGLSGREALRGMLARLQPKEEVLLLGWGVPMPLPVRSRRYDDGFWKELLGKKDKPSMEQNLKELGFLSTEQICESSKGFNHASSINFLLSLRASQEKAALLLLTRYDHTYKKIATSGSACLATLAPALQVQV